jgi:hypothetical protein
MLRLACKQLCGSHDAARHRVDNKARLYISLHQSGRPDGGSPFNRVSAAACPEGAHLPGPPSHLYKLRTSPHSSHQPTDRQAGHMNDDNDGRKGTIFLSINLCKNNVTRLVINRAVRLREKIISKFPQTIRYYAVQVWCSSTFSSLMKCA